MNAQSISLVFCIVLVTSNSVLSQNKVQAITDGAFAKLNSADYSGAVAEFTKAIELSPEIGALYYNRGLAHFGLRQYDKAIEDYSKAIEINPRLADAFNNRGNARGNLGDHIGAIADFDKAIEIGPANARTYFNRGNSKRITKDYGGARADYKKSIEMDPKHAAAYEGCGFVEYNLRDWRAALESFRKCRQLNPSQDDYSRFRIWLIRARLDEQKEATKELAEHLKSLQGKFANEWPAKIGRFLVDDLSEDAFLRAATTSASNLEDQKGQLCEAYYYAGMKRVLAGDKSSAADLFQKCLDTGKKNFDEYSSAEVELSVLNK